MDNYIMKCCANVEIHGLSDKPNPKAALVAFCKPFLPKGTKHAEYGEGGFPSHVIFTQAYGTRPPRGGLYGDKFAAYLADEDLGDVVETEPAKSVRSGNSVQTFVWTPDSRALKAWIKSNRSAFCTCGIDHGDEDEDQDDEE